LNSDVLFWAEFETSWGLNTSWKILTTYTLSTVRPLNCWITRRTWNVRVLKPRKYNCFKCKWSLCIKSNTISLNWVCNVYDHGDFCLTKMCFQLSIKCFNCITFFHLFICFTFKTNVVQLMILAKLCGCYSEVQIYSKVAWADFVVVVVDRWLLFGGGL